MALSCGLAVNLWIHLSVWFIFVVIFGTAKAFPTNCNFTQLPVANAGEDEDDTLTLNDKITIGFTIPGVIVTVVGMIAAVYKFSCNPSKTDEESQENPLELMKMQDSVRTKLEELQKDFSDEKIQIREALIKELHNNETEFEEREKMIQMLLMTAAEVLAERRQLVEFVNQLRRVDGDNDSEYDEVLKRYTDDCEDVNNLNDLKMTLQGHVNKKKTDTECDMVCLTSKMITVLASVNSINTSVKQRICEIGMQSSLECSETGSCSLLDDLKKALDEQKQVITGKTKEIEELDIALSCERLKVTQQSEAIEKSCSQLDDLKKTLDEQEQVITGKTKEIEEQSETIEKLQTELNSLQGQLNSSFTTERKTTDDENGGDILEPESQQKTQDTSGDTSNENNGHGLRDTVVELRGCLYLIRTITTEIARECYYDTRLGELVQVLARTAFGRQCSQEPNATTEGSKPAVSKLLASTVNCAHTILTTLSEGLKWQPSDSFIMPHPLQIQGMIPFKEGLAVFTTINTDQNSIGIIPMESTFVKSPHCIQLSTPHWEGTFPVDIASTDDSILVVCDGKRYIYQFPFRDSNQPSKLVKVFPHDNEPVTMCISIDNTYEKVIVGIADDTHTSGAVVMSLPDFSHMYIFDFRTRGVPRGFDFIISESPYYNYLAYNKRTVYIRSIDNEEKEKIPDITAPIDYDIVSAIFGPGHRKVNDIAIACKSRTGGTDALFRYIWDDRKKDFVPAGTLVDSIDIHGMRSVRRIPHGGIANITSRHEVQFYQII